MGFINFVIAILCWSCCRFLETTCMFLYLTVVQRTGSELEVVWFLMSDCISNQTALTTDLLSETDQTSPTETKINTVIGSINQCGRHISEVIHTGWPVTVFLTTLHIQKKKLCATQKVTAETIWVQWIHFLVQGRVQSGPHLCTMTIISLNC